MTGRLRKLAFMAAVIWGSVASGQGMAPSTTADAGVRAAIERGNAEYIAAFAHSDPAALARVYAPDGARMADKGGYARGRDAIAAVVRTLLGGTGPIQVTIETVDLWVVDDVAYETGKWRYRFTPPGKGAQSVTGRYVTEWKRQPDGGWRIIADVGVPGTEWGG